VLSAGAEDGRRAGRHRQKAVEPTVLDLGHGDHQRRDASAGSLGHRGYRARAKEPLEVGADSVTGHRAVSTWRQNSTLNSLSKVARKRPESVRCSREIALATANGATETCSSVRLRL
jgi:hypothetical protein